MIVLIVLGAIGIGTRAYIRHRGQLAQGDSIWRINYEISFHAPKVGSRLRVALPGDTTHSRVYRQELEYSGLTPVHSRSDTKDTRETTLAAQHTGTFHLTAEFDIHLSPQAKWRRRAPAKDIAPQERVYYLRSTPSVQVENKAVTDVLERLRKDSPTSDVLMTRIFNHCAYDIDTGVISSVPHDSTPALEQGVANPLGRARAMVALLRAAKFPARLVAGFELKEQKDKKDLEPHPWVETFVNQRWEAFDPERGYLREMPPQFVPIRYEAVEVIHGNDLSGLKGKYTIHRIPPPPGILGEGRRRPIEILDLTRLPLETHQVLSLILLVPLGALVTAVFRTIIGIRTFGTFTPTLLALSFIYADWRTGLGIFVVVMVVGLISRSFLDRLKLLLVPRLSVMVTLVVLTMIFGVSLLDYFHLTPTANAVLLPMVILTMTIERFYVTSEEDGVRFAVQLTAATVFLAFCCYLVLRWEQVGELILIYPEFHLFTIASLVLMGRYTGYRMTELWRFRTFLETQELESGGTGEQGGERGA